MHLKKWSLDIKRLGNIDLEYADNTEHTHNPIQEKKKYILNTVIKQVNKI